MEAKATESNGIKRKKNCMCEENGRRMGWGYGCTTTWGGRTRGKKEKLIERGKGKEEGVKRGREVSAEGKSGLMAKVGVARRLDRGYETFTTWWRKCQQFGNELDVTNVSTYQTWLVPIYISLPYISVPHRTLQLFFYNGQSNINSNPPANLLCPPDRGETHHISTLDNSHISNKPNLELCGALSSFADVPLHLLQHWPWKMQTIPWALILCNVTCIWGTIQEKTYTWVKSQARPCCPVKF